VCFVLQREQRKENLKKSRARSLNLIKSGLDILVAAGLLQLAPKSITPRVTGGLGFITSVISCYQVTFVGPNQLSVSLCQRRGMSESDWAGKCCPE
jgi:hypothetical protein